MKASIPSEERLLASRAATREAAPFITVAIPHYKNRRYLEVVLASLFAQTFDDFEILVSDNASPDDSRAVIPPLLQESGRPFRYYVQPSNLGVDGNIRFGLGAAQGRYVFLLGNDDALREPTILQDVASLLRQLDLPEVAFTNYEDWASGKVVRRAHSTRLLGAGPPAAVQYSRTFSFLGGLIYDRTAASRHETDRWDGSIYYLIYLANRILAAGGRLGALDVCAVRKDVRVDGQTVPNYASKWADAPWSFQSRHTGLDSVIRVTAGAILPLLPQAQRSKTLRRIVAQVLTFPYPYWLFEYRRVANWGFAVGIARGMWPATLLAEHNLRRRDRLYLWLLYLAVTFAGLVIPATLFNRMRSGLADFVRQRQQLAPVVKQR